MENHKNSKTKALTLEQIREEREKHYGNDPENSNQLPLIQDEIFALQTRVKTDLLEIGGLLVQGKQICQHGDFKSWVENMGFEYSTANNYMRVYLACAGFPEAVKNIPPSSLYEIASKKCPEEFRNFLLQNNERLEKISKPEIKQLIHQFDKKEINLESPEIKSLLKYNENRNQVESYKQKIAANIADIEKLKQHIHKFVAELEWPTVHNSQTEIILPETHSKKIKSLMRSMCDTVQKLYPDCIIKNKINPKLKIDLTPKKKE